MNINDEYELQPSSFRPKINKTGSIRDLQKVNEMYIKKLTDKTFCQMVISSNDKSGKNNYEAKEQMKSLQNKFTDKELLDLFHYRAKGLNEGDTEDGFLK